jgi:hypothetical protein
MPFSLAMRRNGESLCGHAKHRWLVAWVFVAMRSAHEPENRIEPRMARMGTDYERVMETIFKPVRCILKSVKIRAIRGQNSNESPSNFGVRDEPSGSEC